MKNSNLDIWAIQNDPKEMEKALEGVTDSITNTLFTNCISYLRVGQKQIPVHFDTAFYSEDSDKLILLMKSKKKLLDRFTELLEEKKIGYNEVRFRHGDQMKSKSTKELWFARDPEVLEEAVLESKGKGIDTCDYYPDLTGKLELRYAVDSEAYGSVFDRQAITGVVVLEDKIVLHIDHDRDRKEFVQSALDIFHRNDIGVNIKRRAKELPEEALPKVYKKEQ